MGLKEHKTKLEKFQSLVALFLMIVAFSVLQEDFRTVDNCWTIMRQVSVNMCLSVGMTMVILTGGIDLSVGSVLALTGALAAGFLKNGIEIPALNLFVGVTVPGSIVIAVFFGCVIQYLDFHPRKSRYAFKRGANAQSVVCARIEFELAR